MTKYILISKKKKLEHNYINLVHFGCWNNNPSGEYGLSEVIPAIQQFLKHTKIDLFFVTGDNYYPNKQVIGKEKKKIFDKEKLEFGFQQYLDKIDHHPKDIIMGNHDVSDNYPISIDNEGTLIEMKDNECPIIMYEKDLIMYKKNNNYRFPYAHSIIETLNGKKTGLIYISTDLYDLKELEGPGTGEAKKKNLMLF